ncbi:MAG: putative toxin-antitoxin system toxin component, PIN family [Pirellulaceae bacterium]
MPKIVLDTNIIARALVSPHGLAAEIFQRVISNDHLLCTSGFMLAELDRVLRYPRFRKIHSLSDSEIEDFVRSVQRVEQATQVEDIKQPSTLEKAANLLSLPSSSVLDAAPAKQPFDQWLDPFGKNINANRTTGR